MNDKYCKFFETAHMRYVFILIFVLLASIFFYKVASSDEDIISSRFRNLVLDGPSFNMGNDKLLKWNDPIRICFLGEKRNDTVQAIRNFFYKLRDNIDSVVDTIGGEECGIYIFEMNRESIAKIANKGKDALWIGNEEMLEKMNLVLREYSQRNGIFYMHIWPDQTGSIKKAAIIIDPSVNDEDHINFLSCGIYNSLGLGGVFNMFLKNGCDADIINTSGIDIKIIKIIYSDKLKSGYTTLDIKKILSKHDE